MDDEPQGAESPGATARNDAPIRVALLARDAEGGQALALAVDRDLAIGDASEDLRDHLRLGHAELGHEAGRGHEPAVIIEVIPEWDGSAGIAAGARHAIASETRTLGDRGLLEFRQGAEELEEERTDGSPAVERLGGRTNGDAVPAQGVVGIEERAKRAAQAVDAVDQDRAKAPRLGINQQPLSLGAAGEGHGATDAIIDVLIDHG